MRLVYLILVIMPVLGTEFRSRIRERRLAQQPPNHPAYNQAPASIRQILAAQQARDPIVHIPPQPVPNLAPSSPIEPQYIKQDQLSSYQPKVQVGQAPQQPTYKQIPVRPAQYNPPPSVQQQYNPQPAAQPQYRPQPAAQPQYKPQPAAQPQYRPQPAAQPQQNPQYRTNYASSPQAQQPPAEPNYQYSNNLPPQLQQLLQIQSNLAHPAQVPIQGQQQQQHQG